jgi:hypothetical protein
MIDSSDPWVPFRVSFGGATALRLLLNDIGELDERYLERLQERVENAVGTGYLWQDDYPGEGEWDGYVPIQGAGDRSVTFVPFDEALVLNDQLFSTHTGGREYEWLACGSVLVALHSALDTYAQAIGVKPGRLADRIQTFLAFGESRSSLSVEMDRTLLELDAARHLFVHNQGIVNRRYADQVPGFQLIPGERFPLNLVKLDTYSRTIWSVANLLRTKATGETSG